ncbi:hypothetical protein [Isobaculum melis]|uniref:Uncharacterized protein n=1 Tax=Isobaculum melis TaxID=142588 RepID=A0A1H9Q542_9LACT|nr:hypothetical protein [Isobaculum melis]SER54973.1 hypothetical protein SAMN04488559_101324 [Isobaculum melis]
MTYRERKDYVFYASMALIPGVFLFGLMPLIAMLMTPAFEGPFKSVPIDVLFFAILGACMTLSMISGFLLFTRFISSKSKTFKALNIVFFFIIPFFTYYFFFLISVPYYIYSLVKIRDRRYLKEM